MVSWELECYQTQEYGYFYGVISSEQQNFNGCPAYFSLTDTYGIEDSKNSIYLGNHDVAAPWNKPQQPTDQIFILKFKADWTGKKCKLSIWYQGNKLNETNDEYTLLLPELDDEHVWYPCVSIINEGAYCIIRYA